MIVSSASADVLTRGQVFPLLAGELGVERQLGHPDDPVHRRPDLVAHVGEELALGAARRFGRLLGLAQLLPGLLARRDVAVRHDEAAVTHRALLNFHDDAVVAPELDRVVVDTADHFQALCHQLFDVARAVVTPLRRMAEDIGDRAPHMEKAGRAIEELECASVPRGEAQVGVEGGQSLSHVLQRGLEHERLLGQLRLATPGDREQLRILQRGGALAGQRGEQAGFLLGMRVWVHVGAHEHPVDTAAEHNGRGDVGAPHRVLIERGRAVRGVMERRLREAVVRPAHPSLGVGAARDALAGSQPE